jgi:hypothetical protein
MIPKNRNSVSVQFGANAILNYYAVGRKDKTGQNI